MPLENYEEKLKSLRPLLNTEKSHREMAEYFGQMGTWVFEFSLGKTEWSKQCCKIYGLEPHDRFHTYEEWLSFIHKDDLPEVLQKIEKAKVKFSSISFEFRIVKTNGDVAYVRQYTEYDTDHKGQPIGMYGILKDITNERKTKEQLIAALTQLEHYKAAIDTSAIVSITDETGIITYANEGFCKISKYEVKELVGQKHSIVNSGCHPKSFFVEMWDTVKRGEIWQGEIKNKAKDGSFYWVSTTIKPFYNNNGKIQQYISVRYDITEKKNLTERLENVNKELETRVKTRTSLLEQTNESLEQFVYSISHDLRSPLRLINNSVSILEKNYYQDASAGVKVYLSMIKNSAVRTSNLITDLLHLSKISHGELSTNLVNIDALIQSIMAELTATNLLTPKTVIKTNHIEPTLANGGLLHQVFFNLISNAIKFSSRTQMPEVEIGMISVSDEIVYYVKDNGIGFDGDKEKDLFKPFKRLNSADEFEGTGLGLSIVRQVVTKHGGTVWAESLPGQGATFYFTLCPSSINKSTKLGLMRGVSAA